MTTLKQRFAELSALRPEISQADLARATGAKPPSVNAWFSGDTKSMKADTAAKVAAIYGCNPIWLATGEGSMRSSAPQSTSHLGSSLSIANTEPGLIRALEVVVAALSHVPVGSRKAVADDLGLLAMAPDSSETLARLAASLAPSRQVSALPGVESREFQPPAPSSLLLKNPEKT